MNAPTAYRSLILEILRALSKGGQAVPMEPRKIALELSTDYCYTQ